MRYNATLCYNRLAALIEIGALRPKSINVAYRGETPFSYHDILSKLVGFDAAIL